MITLKERNVIEITKDDLQRMRGSPRRDHHSKFMKEKLELKALSDERAKRWPNTIKALHAKRIQDKKDKEANLERERLKVDALEAAFKAEKRNEMIKRANMMLMLPHISNILVKRQTKNVAEEREAQIVYKQSIKEGWERQERKWLQSQQEEMEKLDKLEKIQAEKRKESVKALALDRLMQLKEHEERITEKKRKKEDERKHLKQLQEEDRVFYEEKDKLKQQRIKEMNEEMVKANDAQKARRREEELRLKKLDKDNEAYAERKEKMMDEKKKQEALKLLAKSKQREAISEKLYKQLLASKVDTERSLARDQNQKKDEYDKKEAMRIQRSKESLETCDKSRKMQLNWKHEQMMKDAAEERYEVERSSECVSRCKMEAQNEEQERFLRNKAFADHQRNMAVYNKKKALEEALRDKEEEKAALQRMEDEEINEISLEDIKL